MPLTSGLDAAADATAGETTADLIAAAWGGGGATLTRRSLLFWATAEGIL